MADQAIHWLFPTPVLQVDLTPTAAVSLAMEQQLALFNREVFSHPEFSDRNNLTGDLLGQAGLDQFHRLDAFQWLNQQLAIHVDAFLKELLGPNHALRFTFRRLGLWSVLSKAGRLSPIATAMLSSALCSMSARNQIIPVGSWSFRLQTITSVT